MAHRAAVGLPIQHIHHYTGYTSPGWAAFTTLLGTVLGTLPSSLLKTLLAPRPVGEAVPYSRLVRRMGGSCQRERQHLTSSLVHHLLGPGCTRVLFFLGLGFGIEVRPSSCRSMERRSAGYGRLAQSSGMAAIDCMTEVVWKIKAKDGRVNSIRGMSGALCRHKARSWPNQPG